MCDLPILSSFQSCTALHVHTIPLGMRQHNGWDWYRANEPETHNGEDSAMSWVSTVVPQNGNNEIWRVRRFRVLGPLESNLVLINSKSWDRVPKPLAVVDVRALIP